jgi:hypothetical protein
MASGRKRQQTIAKRNRERAVEEKRTLKRLAKQAKREAERTGEDPEQAQHATDETADPEQAQDPTDEPADPSEPS